MLLPDLAFEHAANVAAAAAAHAPAYVTYHVLTQVDAPSLHRSRTILRDVAVRTRDDLAVVHDLPDGGTTVEHAFPVLPTFDALSFFTLSWHVGTHMDLTAFVHDVTPLEFSTRTSTADASAERLRAYKVAYAPDSSDAPDGATKLTLAPYDFVKRQARNPGSTFYLSDVSIANGSGLPTSVTYRGGHDIVLTLDYAELAGAWVVQHVHYEETLKGPLSIGRAHATVESTYSAIAFPTAPPDARLAT